MRLDVLYQFNEKYVPYAGISLTSLLESNKEIEEIIIHILLEEVSDASKKKLMYLANLYNRKFTFIETRKLVEEMRAVGINAYRGSYATNMKMFAPLYMDDDVERLLYVDSDTIIIGRLDELVLMNMHSKPVAMVLDSLCGKHKLHIGHHPNDSYFNGGIILFNIQKWKEDKCTERIISHAKNIRAHYMAPDQDLINVVLKKEIYKLDIKYNLQPIHIAYSTMLYRKYFGQENYYSDKEIESAAARPIILHAFRFLGQFPWHKDSFHPCVSYFDKYMEKSLWNDYQKSPTDKSNILFKLERWLYKHTPKRLFLAIFKINYDFFIWKANQDSLRKRNNKNM